MDRFNQLARREQILVAVAACLLVILAAWQLVWSPLNARTSSLEQLIDEKTRLVIDLRRASNLRGTSAGAPVASDETLMLLVVRTARDRGLSFSRSQPDGANALSISFQGVPFDSLIEWLIELQQVHGVNVTSASISGTREAGLVDGQMFVDRS